MEAVYVPKFATIKPSPQFFPEGVRAYRKAKAICKSLGLSADPHATALYYFLLALQCVGSEHHSAVAFVSDSLQVLDLLQDAVARLGNVATQDTSSIPG